MEQTMDFIPISAPAMAPDVPSSSCHDADLSLLRSMSAMDSSLQQELDLELSIGCKESASSRESTSAKRVSPLTIFYKGTVLSYYNVPEEMAQAVISMASAQVSTSGLSLEIPSDGNIQAQNEATEKDLPVKTYAHFGLKQARRASLQRFLEKRRERCRESAAAYSESKGKPKFPLPPSLPASVRDPFGFLSGTRNSLICATRQ